MSPKPNDAPAGADVRARGDKLGDRQRIIAGGLGALVPVVLSLIVVDLETLRLEFTLLSVLSYALRAAGLFFLGALVGWAHKKEHDAFKVLQLGMAAPALLTTLINANRVSVPQTPQTAPTQASTLWFPGVIQSAYAQPPTPTAAATPQTPTIRQYKYPAETPAQQIKRGLFGVTAKNVWYVVVASHLKAQDAETEAAQVRAKGFVAQVYAPYGTNPYYSVIIGANLTQSDAQKLRTQAIQAGLPKDTYLWTFPQK